MRGIAIEGETQIIFVDTPGIFAPKRRLDRAMVSSAWGGAGDADVVALLVDVRKGIDAEVEAILARLAGSCRRPRSSSSTRSISSNGRNCSNSPAKLNARSCPSPRPS